MKDIIDTLRQAHARHCSVSGDTPDCMYLGHDQWSGLLDHLFGYGFHPTHTQLAVRPRWCGMVVYRVDADSYVGFGQEGTFCSPATKTSKCSLTVHP